MTETLQALIDAAKQIESTPEHREEQRRSFAFGNTHFENELITREMVDRQAAEIERERLTSDAVR